MEANKAEKRKQAFRKVWDHKGSRDDQRARDWGVRDNHGGSPSECPGQVCFKCQQQSFIPLVAVKTGQQWTQGHRLACRKVRSTHTLPHKCSCRYMDRLFGGSTKNLCLLYTVCSDDYLMRFDAGVLWALSELARAPMHFNVLSLSHCFVVPVSYSRPSLPTPPLA